MDDLQNTVSERENENKLLTKLDDLLLNMGSIMEQFPDLPQPSHVNDSMAETQAFRRKRYCEKLDNLREKLSNNKQQLNIFDKIVKDVEKNLPEQFVVNAIGGCGKAHLFECLSSYVRSKGRCR